MFSKAPINELVNAVEMYHDDVELPAFVLQQIAFSTEGVVDLLHYYMAIKGDDIVKEEVCLRILSKYLVQLRYEHDRKSKKAMATFDRLQITLSSLFSHGLDEKLFKLNHLLYESALPFTFTSHQAFSPQTSEGFPDMYPSGKPHLGLKKYFGSLILPVEIMHNRIPAVA